MNFKVGDKVRILDAKSIDFAETDGFETGGIYKVVKLDRFNHPILADGESRLHFYKSELQYIEKVEPKKPKNERITELEKQIERIPVLENEVAELKVIVEQLRTSKTIEPSAIEKVAQDEIIEFEGAQYRKVDREAREGDVVMQNVEHSVWMEKGRFYKMVSDKEVLLGKVKTKLYTGWGGRTPKIVDVYERIQQELTPNQQRAQAIEKAKKFVETKSHYLQDSKFVKGGIDAKRRENPNFSGWQTKVEFIVNAEKRTVVAIIRNMCSDRIRAKGIAKCHPDNVFNEHIGKAIALGRALGIDVSEFEQAVQPNEVVVGHVVLGLKTSKIDTIVEIEGTGDSRKLILRSFDPWHYTTDDYIKEILDDTNAIY